MSAIDSVNSATFAGQGRARIAIVCLFVIVALALIFGYHIPKLDIILDTVNKRTEAGYSALFTFLTVFWASVLTIWSLLKSRATRYVERLSENVVFMQFMRDLEARLIVGMVAVVISFVVYIVNPSVILPPDYGTAFVGAWAVIYGTAIILLSDSLLTARVLL
jgi:hypothetical protein